jgi:hypothetical protein
MAGATRTNRAKRSVGRSALLAAGGATLFELAMQAKLSLFRRARELGTAPPAGSTAVVAGAGGSSGGERFGGGGGQSPLYRSLSSLVCATSIDLMVSSAVLVAVIQPRRFPLAFGGWALGRLVALSQEVELAFSVVEMDA